MKRNILALLSMLSFVASGFLFAGCDDDCDDNSNYVPKLFVQVYDVPGYKTLNDYTTVEGAVTFTPVGVVVSTPLDMKFPVRSTRVASKNLSFTMKVDNSLVDTFNAANETEYLPMPDGAVLLTNTELHISKGEEIGYDSVKVELNPAMLDLLESGKMYLAPIAITNIKGSQNVVASSNRGALYAIVKAASTNCYDNAKAADMTGTLTTDRSTWSAVVESTPSTTKDPSVIFQDNSSELYYRCTEFAVTVDMKSEFSLTGMRIHVYGSSYRWNQAEVYTSTDGVNFTSQGAPKMGPTESNWQYIRFYGPVTARYVKLVCLSKQSTYIDLVRFTTYVE